MKPFGIPGPRLKQLLPSRMAFPFLAKSSKVAGIRIHGFSYPNLMKFVLQISCSCFSPLKNFAQLEDFLWSMYTVAAQYDHPPRYPVTIICDAIDGASPGSGIVDRIAAGVFAYKGNLSCYMNQARDETETDVGWRWQVIFLLHEYRCGMHRTSKSFIFFDVLRSFCVVCVTQRCSEMVMPLSTGNDTMFPAYNFELGSFIDYCNELYGVSPRPHWVTTYYGGHVCTSTTSLFFFIFFIEITVTAQIYSRYCLFFYFLFQASSQNF